ncbi:MAG: HD domain-containing protein, partial [Chloroflexi bacterium]|nr:HD domain-containing protein [Chloroflexota bacterium]
SSANLRLACRKSDIAARVGGDEFIILLPNTSRDDAGKILARIKSGFADARVEGIRCSASLGLDTKQAPEQSLDEIMANAADAMYLDKTMNRKSINKNILSTIIESLHARYPEEKRHALAVSALCADVGAALHLPTDEIAMLERAGYLHDIGKITLDEIIIAKGELSDEENEQMQQHTAVGYRVLSLFDDTLDLAEHVYGHHERWDGAGYPRGLKGEQIPLLSRIIAVAETYDRVLNRGELPLDDRERAALNALVAGAGTKFDPPVVEVFVAMVAERQAAQSLDATDA